MLKHTFAKNLTYKFCFLVNDLNVENICKEYLDPFGIDKNDVVILSLYKDPLKKKTSIKDLKSYVTALIPEIYSLGSEYIMVCDAEYYKVITKEKKADPFIGYIKTVDVFKVLYVPDIKGIFYDPEKVRAKISLSLTALSKSLIGTYRDPGSIQVKGMYPKTYKDVLEALKALNHEPVLTCDIETFSLSFHRAGIGSIAFAKNTEEGVAFLVDPEPGKENKLIRNALKDFFKHYKGKLIFHNIAFDATVLIYQLYMEDIQDSWGLYEGILDILRLFEDTKLIAYLATNSCAGNDLSLKSLAQEFAGNYAQEDIKDITKIPVDELLEYNLRDCLATWFVYNKYYPLMVQAQQKQIYEEVFRPATIDIVQMQLTGLPLDMERVLEVEKILEDDFNNASNTIQSLSIVKSFIGTLNQDWVDKKNATLKKKQVTLTDASCEFNPASNLQLQKLLYTQLGLPVLNTTMSNQPSTDMDTLKALVHQTKDPEVITLLQSLLDYSAVAKILTAFIPAFKKAPYSVWLDCYFLTGNFNLGGTVSGRLSSSNPNLNVTIVTRAL